MTLELLFDQPIIGQSRYGEYYLFSVRNGTDEEYSFFAPEEISEQLKSLKKGDRFQITKTARQNGNKVITGYDVKILSSGINEDKTITPAVSKDNYFEAMMNSYSDAMKIQQKFNGLVDVNRIAITLFIARSKLQNNSC